MVQILWTSQKTGLEFRTSQKTGLEFRTSQIVVRRCGVPSKNSENVAGLKTEPLPSRLFSLILAFFLLRGRGGFSSCFALLRYVSGGHNAHYEPTNNIINLTKNRGDGSFGHEFMHFLDYTIGKHTYRGRWSGKPKGRGRFYRSSRTDEISLKITQALTEGINLPVEVTYHPEENFDRNFGPVKEEMENNRTYEEAVQSVREKEERGEFVSLHVYQAIANVYRKPVVRTETKRSTELLDNSKKMKGGKDSYWTKPQELWARAFQAYLEDKMEEKGIKNNYLTRPTKEVSIYPQGEERKALNKLFDELFGELAKDYPQTGDVKFRFTQER